MVRKFLLVFCFLLFGCLYDSPNFQESDYLPLNDSDYPYAGLPRLVIETKDFNNETMESKLKKGVFACGEVLDIDGDCGGFNLQWAFSSGFVAGNSAVGNML